VAERFELYACGVELANGFGELTDPEEQRRRFEAEMDEKERVYGERYPWTRTSWPPSRTCPPPPASRWASTGW
jgi:elongation factor P--beta-lysine ligase